MSRGDFFAYGRLTDEALYRGVVGRRPEGGPAELTGYRLERAVRYDYLVQDDAGRVEGRLIPDLEPSEFWILDDHHGAADGLYERRRVTVETAEGPREAWTYVGGPLMRHLAEDEATEPAEAGGPDPEAPPTGTGPPETRPEDARVELPAAVLRIFEAIRQGPEFPHAWLATRDVERGARVRTVVVLEAELEHGLFRLGSDRRHRKAEELQADPWGELCLASLHETLQIRFRCRFRVQEAPTVRARLWSRVPGRDRARFYGSEPGDDEPSPWFMALEAEVAEVDLLDLRPEVPDRRGFVRRGEAFAEQPRPA